ncbi:MAG: hypothetical protein GY861_27705 [bacterium]|nr:hypothetical protein [bacterium]
MDFIVFVGIVFFILLTVILFKILKNLVRAIFLVTAVFTILLILSGLLVFIDSADFKKNAASDKLVMAAEGNRVLSGFILRGQTPILLSDEESKMYSLQYANDELKKMRGTNYKVYVFEIAALEALEKNAFIVEDRNLPKSTIISVLKANDPFPEAASALDFDEDVLRQSYEVTGIKAIFFAPLVQEALNVESLAKGLKDDTITVYPETMMFKALRILPSGIVGIVMQEKVEAS